MSAAIDHGAELQDRVQKAFVERTPLRIEGGGSKAFLGGVCEGAVLSLAGHRGVVSYEPTELVITARTGTRLAELETLLADSGQMLAFEPPHFGAAATLGGTIAAGLSGPRRPYAGSARDFVLGVKLINGWGEVLGFGGEVMKNVAGYDVSRLMTGAMGTLGVLLEVSLKVLPLPEQELTLVQECSAQQALERTNAWAGRPLPISAACHVGGRLHLRLSGVAPTVRAAREHIGGEPLADGTGFWRGLREQELDFFADARPLWRLSVAPGAPQPTLEGDWLLDWGGAQRWLKSEAPAPDIRAAAERLGGHATLFRGTGAAVFHPLPEALMQLHRNLKQAFDPAGIFNRGRLYPEL